MQEPNLPKIQVNGITVYDAREWFPYKGDGGAVVFRPRDPDEVGEVAIHHDAVAFSGLDLNFDGSTVDEERARMQASYNWHTKYWPGTQSTRGDGWNWPGMGYHLYVFPKSGRIYLVGELSTSRAHVAYRNPFSIGIVGAGDFTTRPPGGPLIFAYGRAVAFSWLWRGEQLPADGHRKWAEKNPPAVRNRWLTSCPGDTSAGDDSWIADVITVANVVYQAAVNPPVVEEDLEMKLVREASSAYVFVFGPGVFYSYLHRIEDATELEISTEIEVVADGTLASYVRADKDWMAFL